MTKRKESPAAAPSAPTPSSAPTTPRYNLAIDAGNGYTKIRGDNALSVDFRSIIAPLGGATRIGAYTDDDFQSVIGVNGSWWVVGDRAYTLAPTTIQEYPSVGRYGSAWYKVLISSALHRAFSEHLGAGVIYPRIVASIPAEIFKSKAEMERIRAALLGEYSIENIKGSTLHVVIHDKKIIMIPEGVGTYFGYVFGAGDNTRFINGTWGVVDSGYLTLDAVFLRNGEYIAELSRSDEKTGVSVVANDIRDYVFSQTRVRLDRAAIDKAIECDELTVNARSINIKETKESGFVALAGRAAHLIETWATGINLTGIILTGGGAEHLFPYLSDACVAPVYLAPRPRRANVEGSYLYLVDDSE